MRTTLRAAAPLMMFAVVATSAACTDDSTAGTPVASGSAGSGGAAGSGTAGTGGDGPGGSGGTVGTAGTGGAAGSADANGTGGGDASDAAVEGGGLKLASSMGPWVVFDEPYGDGGAANPIMATIKGSAEAFPVTK